MPHTRDRTRAPAPPPDGTADTPTRSPQEFCRALKAARERKGITLARISEATKVCPSHLAALERGDVSRWPKGLFRRAFFRGYAGTIGLPVAEALDEFLRLFPEDEGARPAAAIVPAAPALPLALDTSWHGPRVPIVRRLATAAVDGVVVAVIAMAAALSGRLDVAMAAAIATVSYFTLGTVLFGESPAAWVMRWRRTRASMPAAAAAEVPVSEPASTVPAWRRGVEAVTRLLGKTGDAGAKESGEGEQRVWTTDARRVRPRDFPPRLRVRFKLGVR